MGDDADELLLLNVDFGVCMMGVLYTLQQRAHHQGSAQQKQKPPVSTPRQRHQIEKPEQQAHAHNTAHPAHKQPRMRLSTPGARPGRSGTGRAVAPTKQAPKQRQKLPTEDVVEGDIALKGADSDEEGEIASLVALVSRRDAALEQELQTARGRPAHTSVAPLAEQGSDDLGGNAPVVEFDDHDDDVAGGKKRRKFAPAIGAGGARADSHKARASSGTAGAGSQPPASATVRPGQFTHGRAGLVTAELFDVAGRAGGGGSTPSHPPGSWQAQGLSPRLCEQLQQLGFERPTRVQAAALPVLLARRDVLVRAPTGSGKTLSFLLPIIQDLASQIHDVATQLLRRFIWLVAGVLIGGENRSHEKARLRKGLTLLVASPGRLADHLVSTAAFKTDKLRWLVLDEADRLLDLGFEARLKEIVELLDRRSGNKASQRTTALLSATLHASLGALAAVSLREPVPVGFTVQKSATGELSLSEAALPGAAKAGKAAAGGGPSSNTLAADGETYVLPSQLRQAFIEVEAKQRLVTLAGLLRQKLLGNRFSTATTGGTEQGTQAAAAAKRKAVVFFASRDGVELHHTLLGGPAWHKAAGGPLLGGSTPLLKLHGDMQQAERTAAFVAFTKADTAVLLCTDVAARGLDFPDVTLIVQYDVPAAATEYVHRVGRTARMGHAGEAVLFLMPHERQYVALLASRGITLAETSAEGPLRFLPQVAGSMDGEHVAGKKAAAEAKKGPMALAFSLQRRIMQAVAADAALHSLAADAFRSFVGAYATHSGDLKRLFHVRNLHLGHVAFAHGLKDAPTTVGASASAAERKRKRKAEIEAKHSAAKRKLFKAARAVGKRALEQ